MTGPIQLGGTGLGYRRGGRDILDDVDITARPFEVLAVTGPSGSGKSSLLAILAGLQAPDRGSVRRPVSAEPGAIPDGFGLVLQGYGLASVLTAAENVEIVLQGQGLDREELSRRADSALAAVGLSEAADHLVEELSGGQQQRVAIARALVIEPRVLLADELTAELDHGSAERVLERVFALADTGSIVVICTHDPAVAARCHREVGLRNGRVVSTR